MLSIGNGDGAADFQALENRAVLFGGTAMAFLAQSNELLLQGYQAVYPRLDVMDVFINQVVDALTLVLGLSRRVNRLRISSRVMSRMRQLRMNVSRST